jgi:ribose 1,5-bisphosphokinase
MMASALIERELASVAFPVRNGVFVAVVGPSGAGKDTIMAFARDHFAGEASVEFVRRVITRPSDAAAEDHDTLADAAFDEAEAHGAFALSWQAHGLKYGLPASVDDAIAEGRVAVANLSRGALPALRDRYANVVVVEITARPEILAGAGAARPLGAIRVQRRRRRDDRQ